MRSLEEDVVCGVFKEGSREDKYLFYNIWFLDDETDVDDLDLNIEVMDMAKRIFEKLEFDSSEEFFWDVVMGLLDLEECSVRMLYGTDGAEERWGVRFS